MTTFQKDQGSSPTRMLRSTVDGMNEQHSNTRQRNETLQLRYAKLAALNSKIPIKNRQVSIPIHPLDETAYSANVKKSCIPRIVSSPSTPMNLDHLTPSTSERKSLSPIVNKLSTELSTPQYKVTKAATPPSTLTKLSYQLADLSLNTPSPSKSKSDVKYLRGADSSIRPYNEITNSRSKAQSSSTSRSVSSPHLGKRASQLLKTRIQLAEKSGPSKNPSASSIKISTQSIPRESPSKRSVSISSKKKTAPVSHESPLLSRLTRSTTASDLKSNIKQRTVSSQLLVKNRTSQSSKSTIKPVKRVVSELPRSSTFTRSIRPTLPKQDVIKESLQSKAPLTDEFPRKLDIPKKRTIPKSFTINSNLSGLNNSPTPDVSRRVRSGERKVSTPIPRRKVSSSTTVSNRIRTAEQLYKALLSYPKTNKIVSEWNDSSTVTRIGRKGQSPQDVLESVSLNSYEKVEVLKVSEVFYLGNTGHKRDSSTYTQNFGFDDTEKNLIVHIHDHVNYRFEVLMKLGTGMFGNVLKCKDHKSDSVVGVKIMKNDVTWSLQSLNEIKILKTLDHPRILRYFEYFSFRSHIGISTELLVVNLLEALEASEFRGFDMSTIKLWFQQLLSGLDYLHTRGIIHADLKPENIMLVSPNSLDLKIIDFGSSCYEGETVYPYIQSRFYRAPEVMLGCRYNTKIDIWSSVALLYEMHTGRPLFEARDETHLYKLMVRLMGHPSPKTVLSLRDELFEQGSINKHNDPNYLNKRTMIFTKFGRLGDYKGLPIAETPKKDQTLSKILGLSDLVFGEFIGCVLNWDYRNRPTAYELLQHEFLK